MAWSLGRRQGPTKSSYHEEQPKLTGAGYAVSCFEHVDFLDIKYFESVKDMYHAIRTVKRGLGRWHCLKLSDSTQSRQSCTHKLVVAATNKCEHLQDIGTTASLSSPFEYHVLKVLGLKHVIEL